MRINLWSTSNDHLADSARWYIIRKALGPVRLHIPCPHPSTTHTALNMAPRHFENTFQIPQSHCWGDLVRGCSPLKDQVPCSDGLETETWTGSVLGKSPGPTSLACDFQKELNNKIKTEWEGKRRNLKRVNLWNSIVKFYCAEPSNSLVTSSNPDLSLQISRPPFWSCHPCTVNWAGKTWRGPPVFSEPLTLVQREGG